jgi:excisionase family DNA binding protein
MNWCDLISDLIAHAEPARHERPSTFLARFSAPSTAGLDDLGQPMDKLIVSVPEAAELLGVSDDLVYELTERGDLPCIRLGRRKVIPRKAIESLVEQAVTGFDSDVAKTVTEHRSTRNKGQPKTDDSGLRLF